MVSRDPSRRVHQNVQGTMNEDHLKLFLETSHTYLVGIQEIRTGESVREHDVHVDEQSKALLIE